MQTAVALRRFKHIRLLANFAAHFLIEEVSARLAVWSPTLAYEMIRDARKQGAQPSLSSVYTCTGLRGECQPNCTSTCDPAPNGFLTVLNICPSPAAVVLNAACPSASLATTAAPSHCSLALPAPKTFGPAGCRQAMCSLLLGELCCCLWE